MKKILLTTACLFGFALSSTGVNADNLQDTVTQALKAHPSLQRANINTDIAIEGVAEEQSEYFPTLSVEMGAGRIYGDNSTSRGLNTTRGSGYSWLYEGRAALNQTVWDWLETKDRVRAANADAMSSYHDAENTRETIAFEAVRAHINLHRASIMLGEAELLAERMISFKERMDRLVSGGGADAAQAARARDYLLLANNRLARAKGQYKSAQAQYIEIVGSMPDGALNKPAAPFALNTDEDINKLIVDIQNNHPQVRSLIESSVGLYYDAQAEGKNILPEISSELSYSKKDQRDVIGGESTDARAMLRMNWSFDLGGAQRSRARQAKMQEQAALTDLELLRRNIERDLRTSLANISVTQEQFDIQKSRYETALETVDTYNKQFKGGKRSLLELMQSESDAFGVKNDYVSSEYAVLEAAYQFLSTQGKITEAIEILAFLEEDSRAHEAFLDEVDDTVERVDIPSAEDVNLSNQPLTDKANASPENLLEAGEPVIEDMSVPQDHSALDNEANSIEIEPTEMDQAAADIAEPVQEPYSDKKKVDFVTFKFNPERPTAGE